MKPQISQVGTKGGGEDFTLELQYFRIHESMCGENHPEILLDSCLVLSLLCLKSFNGHPASLLTNIY